MEQRKHTALIKNSLWLRTAPLALLRVGSYAFELLREVIRRSWRPETRFTKTASRHWSHSVWRQVLGALVGSFNAIINQTWHYITGLIKNLLYIVYLGLQRCSFQVTAVRQTQVKIHAYSSIFPLAGSPLFSRIICYKLSNEGCRLFIPIEFWQGNSSKIHGFGVATLQ